MLEKRCNRALPNRKCNDFLFPIQLRRLGTLDRVSKKLGHWSANVDIDGLVVAGQGVGEVAEGLAVVDNSLAAQLEGKNTLGLITVRLLAESLEDRAVVDGSAHGELVLLAGVQNDVVDEDGTDLLAENVVAEGGIALGKVSKK